MNMKISIITVCYKNRTGLIKTLNSVWSQTYNELETIVVDGGSNDGTVQFIDENKFKVAYFISEPDRGIYNAMNKGIRRATGDFCVFMNAGDEFFSKTVVEDFVRQVADMNAVYFGRALTIGNGREWLFPNKSTNDEMLSAWLEFNQPNHQAMFFPREFYCKNYYNPKFKFSGDTEYKWRAYKRVKYIFLNCIVCKFYMGGISNNGDFNTSLRRVKEHFAIRKMHKKLDKMHCLWIVGIVLFKYFLSRLSQYHYHYLIELFGRHCSFHFYNTIFNKQNSDS